MNHTSLDLDHRAPEPGDTLRAAGVEYRVMGRLGRGGMAHVLDVEDLDLGKRFALKLLDPHLASHPESLERFESEARALARLDHPNIVTVMRLDRTEDEQRPFFLMERLRGGTLRDHMNRGAVSARRALATAAQLSRALHYVHARGLLHRDVKPSNVFLHVDAFGAEVVKLLDFGVMRLVHAGAAEDGFYGTAHYAAPEQLVLGAAQGPETDVYAAGLVLFEALTGRHPFEDAERTLRAARAVRQRGAPALREKLPPGRLSDEALAEVGPLVASMLCKNPLGRPTADAVARALTRCLRRVPDERAPAHDLGQDAPLRTRSPELFLPAHLAGRTRPDPPPLPPPPPSDPASASYEPVSDADLVGTLESPVLLLRAPTAATPSGPAGPAACGRRSSGTTPLRAAAAPPEAHASPSPSPSPSPSLSLSPSPSPSPSPSRGAPTAPTRRAAAPAASTDRAARAALGALAVLWLALAIGGLGVLRRRGLLPAARRAALAHEVIALAERSRALAPALTR